MNEIFLCSFFHFRQKEIVLFCIKMSQNVFAYFSITEQSASLSFSEKHTYFGYDQGPHPLFTVFFSFSEKNYFDIFYFL